MSHIELSTQVTTEYLREFLEYIENTVYPTDDPTEKYYVERGFAAARTVVNRMEQVEPNLSAERTGGIMVIGRKATDDQKGYLVVREICAIANETHTKALRTAEMKRNKYTFFALFKAAVLLMHQDVWLHSSGDNAKLAPEEQVKYEDGTTIPKGAFWLDDDHFISFSSFMPEDDEAVNLFTAELAQLTYSYWPASDIARSLENSRYNELHDQVLPPKV